VSLGLPLPFDLEIVLFAQQQTVVHQRHNGKLEEIHPYFFKRMDEGAVQKGNS